MSKATLSLGSNIGNLTHNLDKALLMLEQQAGKIVKTTEYYETEPWGMDTQNRFLNAITIIDTPHKPLYLLQLTQEIERLMGRMCKSTDGLYEDRIIDIDILYYDDVIMNTPELTIPHPLIQQRQFILQGLQMMNIINK